MSSRKNINHGRNVKEINNFVDEKVDFGQSSESDDDGVVVTIGDIETNLPSQRNINGYSKEYKPPSRTVTSYPTTEEIQQKLEARLREKEQQQQHQASGSQWKAPHWKKKHHHNRNNESQSAAGVMPFHSSRKDELVILDFDVHTYQHGNNRINNTASINKTAAEKLPPIIRDIVTSVAATNGNPQAAVKMPTVNFTTSAAAMIPTRTRAARSSANYDRDLPPPIFFNAPRSSTSSTTATVSSLPPDYNPNIPPPNFRTNLPTPSTRTVDKKDVHRIDPVQALLRQYSNEGTSSSSSKAPSRNPDRNVREQHLKLIDRNRHRDSGRVGDNYRIPGYFFNTTLTPATTRRRSRSRSPHHNDMPLQQEYRRDKKVERTKTKFSKSALIPDKNSYV